MKVNFRLILSLLGYLITGVGALMLIPTVVEFFTGGRGLITFLVLSILTMALGLAFALSNNQERLFQLSIKDGLLLTTLSWLTVVLIGALPFYLGYLDLSFTDSFFEIMSGITTTGATIIPDLNKLSDGYQIWRALIQWVGGIGIIVTATILFPSLQGGGMQLFKIEAFETFDVALDKVKRIANGMIIIYVVITIIVFFALVFIGHLGAFDAIIHAFTSISTAGFSNKNESVAYFNSVPVEIILIFAMITGGLPYMLMYYLAFLKKTQIFTDQQVKGYLKTLIFFIMLLTVYLSLYNGIPFFTSLRYSAFTVVSLITGTGYVNYNYLYLGNFAIALLFFTMFVGGCAGSTACGIKIYRFQIAYSLGKSALNKIFLKKHFSIPYYNGKIINEEVGFAIFAYFFFLMLILAFTTLVLAGLNLDFVTSLSAAVTCIMNVGPGLGNIVGPIGNFATIPDTGKWVLAIGMLLGRLEILGVIVLFNKRFWQS